MCCGYQVTAIVERFGNKGPAGASVFAPAFHIPLSMFELNVFFVSLFKCLYYSLQQSAIRDIPRVLHAVSVPLWSAGLSCLTCPRHMRSAERGGGSSTGHCAKNAEIALSNSQFCCVEE